MLEAPSTHPSIQPSCNSANDSLTYGEAARRGGESEGIAAATNFEHSSDIVLFADAVTLRVGSVWLAVLFLTHLHPRTVSAPLLRRRHTVWAFIDVFH